MDGYIKHPFECEDNCETCLSFVAYLALGIGVGYRFVAGLANAYLRSEQLSWGQSTDSTEDIGRDAAPNTRPRKRGFQGFSIEGEI